MGDIPFKECCGCAACQSICPVNAISMRENEKGFLVPCIDEKICVNCGLCERVCKTTPEFRTIKKIYIGRLKNEEELKMSQSGGAFVAISDVVFEMGGVVYGCALDEHLEAVHIRAESFEDRDRMRKSKYIQSYTGGVYAKVERDLKDRKVLFTGTPCQIGGLLKYCETKKINTNNLLTMDIVCHGVPSVWIWRKLLRYHEDKAHTKVIWAVFRDNGWQNSITTLECEGGKKIYDRFQSNLYHCNLALRTSCYVCEYAKQERVSDFMVGDAWGVKKNNPELWDKKGISLLAVNSEKAMQLFGYVEKMMNLKQVELKDYSQYNMCQPSRPHRNCDEFWRDYYEKPFWFIIEKYSKNNPFFNMKYIVKKFFHIRKMS